jgi:hypothetical protein
MAKVSSISWIVFVCYLILLVKLRQARQRIEYLEDLLRIREARASCDPIPLAEIIDDLLIDEPLPSMPTTTRTIEAVLRAKPKDAESGG